MLFFVRGLRMAVVSLKHTLRIQKTASSIAIALLLSCATLSGQAAIPGPNSDPTYQALRNISLGGEAISLSNFDLKRDAATFHLRSGTVCFVTAVNGKVTGAVFVGDGNFVLSPPTSELGMLKLLTK